MPLTSESKSELLQVAKVTSGFTGADLQALLYTAQLTSLKEVLAEKMKREEEKKKKKRNCIKFSFLLMHFNVIAILFQVEKEKEEKKKKCLMKLLWKSSFCTKKERR